MCFIGKDLVAKNQCTPWFIQEPETHFFVKYPVKTGDLSHNKFQERFPQNIAFIQA